MIRHYILVACFGLSACNTARPTPTQDDPPAPKVQRTPAEATPTPTPRDAALTPIDHAIEDEVDDEAEKRALQAFRDEVARAKDPLPLLDVATKSPNGRIRADVATWVSINGTDPHHWLERLATDPNPNVRSEVAFAMGTVSVFGDIRQLATLAHDPVAFVRMHALGTLDERGDEASESILQEMTKDPSEVIRADAARAIEKRHGRVGD